MNFNNKTPNLIVDHINGVTLDNRKQNLRITSYSTQQRNVKIRNNTTGVPNLTYETKRQIYKALFRFNKNVYQKSFSCNKYPNARELAIQWLETKKAEIIPKSEIITRDLLQP